MPVHIVSEAGLPDGLITQSGPLSVDIGEFNLTLNGEWRHSVAVVLQPVVDNAVNYFWLDDNNLLQTSTSSYPTFIHLRLGRVVTSGGAITSIIDDRAFLQMDSPPSYSGTGNPNGSVTGLFGDTYRDTNTGIWYRCASSPKGTGWTVV